MTNTITIQLATEDTTIPNHLLLKEWAQYVLESQGLSTAVVNFRIVDETEMTQLNAAYRHKQGPTNVLSFPFAVEENVVLEQQILGDVVICPAVVSQEAVTQGKSYEAHWAHMIIHGLFHLLGYDHIEEEEAKNMETLEIAIMQQLGFANPYEFE